LQTVHQLSEANPVVRAWPEGPRETVVRGDKPTYERACVVGQARDTLCLVSPTLGQAREGAPHKATLGERRPSEAIEPAAVNAKLPALVGFAIVVVESGEVNSFGIKPEMLGVRFRALRYGPLVGVERHLYVAE
jgi:hypothetical protein